MVSLWQRAAFEQMKQAPPSLYRFSTGKEHRQNEANTITQDEANTISFSTQDEANTISFSTQDEANTISFSTQDEPSVSPLRMKQTQSSLYRFSTSTPQFPQYRHFKVFLLALYSFSQEQLHHHSTTVSVKSTGSTCSLTRDCHSTKAPNDVIFSQGAQKEEATLLLYNFSTGIYIEFLESLSRVLDED